MCRLVLYRRRKRTEMQPGVRARGGGLHSIFPSYRFHVKVQQMCTRQTPSICQDHFKSTSTLSLVCPKRNEYAISEHETAVERFVSPLFRIFQKIRFNPPRMIVDDHSLCLSG